MLVENVSITSNIVLLNNLLKIVGAGFPPANGGQVQSCIGRRLKSNAVIC